MSGTARSAPRRASALRALSLVLAFAAALGLVFGTAGFTAMEADRGLAVTVTNDDSAYLGYETLTDDAESGASTEVVEFHNRFSGKLDEFAVDVSIANHESTGASIDATDTPAPLGGGDAASVSVTLTCTGGNEEVDLTFDVDGQGSGVSVSLERTHTVTVTCESKTDTSSTREAGTSSTQKTDESSTQKTDESSTQKTQRTEPTTDPADN